jgi:hypothetical protein
MQPVCDRLSDDAQAVPDNLGLVPGIHAFMVGTGKQENAAGKYPAMTL